MSMEGSTRDRGSGQVVVVDLGAPQPSARVDRLRKGKGKLYERVEKIVGDLVAAGTVRSGAQAVVIVVSEYPSPPPPPPLPSPPPRPPWAYDDIDDED